MLEFLIAIAAVVVISDTAIKAYVWAKKKGYIDEIEDTNREKKDG